MSIDAPHQVVILHGNPVDGHTLIGPFKDVVDANEWADGLDGEWWCMTLQAPSGGYFTVTRTVDGRR